MATPNPDRLSLSETVSDGQFDWGGRLLKVTEAPKGSPQNGWKSFAECKGIRELDCERLQLEQGRKIGA